MKPVREIPIQNLSVRGKFPSRKNQRLVSYESQLELAFLYHLEFSDEVSYYVEQPCKVKSPNGSYYVPDFLVFFKDPLKKPLLVEIKYLRDIKRNLDKILQKMETLEKYALTRGYSFKLLTDKELLNERTENYKFLYNYFSAPVDGEDYKEYTQNILNLLRERQPLRAIEIAQILGKGEFVETGLYLSTVWHLIAKSVLWANLNEKLTSHSLVYLEEPNRFKERCLL